MAHPTFLLPKAGRRNAALDLIIEARSKIHTEKEK